MKNLPPPRAGFALILTLLILSVLAVVAVSFLASMSAERATAAAFSNNARAEQAARAGADTAMATLRQAFQSYPDSVAVWDIQQSTNSVGPANEGTTLYLRAVPTSGGDAPDPAGENRPLTPATYQATPRKIFVLPLVSGVIGGKPKLLENKAEALPLLDLSNKDLTQRNFTDLNIPRFLNDTQGWVGSPPTTTGGAPKPVRVPWVELQTPRLDDPAKLLTTARYAYWVEDESFRANINYAGLGVPPAPSSPERRQRRDNRQNLALGPADVDLFSPLSTLADTKASDDAQSIFDTRKLFPRSLFPDLRSLAHSPDVNNQSKTLYATKPDLLDQLRFLTTTTSGGLNLSRHGSQRLNLNAVVDQSVLPTNTGAIQDQIDKIVATLQFHAPNLGQRFYRNTASATPNELNAFSVTGMNAEGMDIMPYHARMYLYKLAANIRDYIDLDSFPTCIMPGVMPNGSLSPNGVVRGPGAPSVPIGDPPPPDRGPPWAVGKDASPFMQECAARYTGSITGTGAAATYKLTTDYYVEVWNMSNRDVRAADLGPNAFIRIGNPTKWVGCRTDNYNLQVPLPATGTVSPSDTRPPATIPPQPTPRDFDIDITGVNFPAGVVTVITTDPDWRAIITDQEARNHVTPCNFKSPGTRIYTGPMPRATAAGVAPITYCNAINMVFDNTSTSDFETDVVIGSDYGHIDSLSGALTLSWGGRISFPSTSTLPPIFGGYLRGNWTNTGSADAEGKQASAVGDPRTNNEQINYDPSSNSSSDKTRYTNFAVGNSQGVFPTLGLPNYQSVRPARPENPWPDFPPLFPADHVLTAAMAPAVIANAPLTSIGQLGDVFDPARIATAGSTSSRGGGRTLKIGQHDDRWDGDETSASREWTSWRLADFFCIADAVSQPGLIQPNGIDQPGLINLNGAARDKGAALRAALTGFRFQPASLTGDPALADPADTSQPSKFQVDSLINQVVDRLTKPLAAGQFPAGTSQTGAGPFWERGELSELPLFGRSPGTTPAATYSTTDLAGVDLSSKSFDRGREELVRRLVEMTTTRGSVFTVYAVGQALTQGNPNDVNTRRIVGTQRLKITFRLVPKNMTLDPATGRAANFHPGTDEATGKSLDGGTNFNPNDPASLKARFEQPDHYEVEIISASGGND